MGTLARMSTLDTIRETKGKRELVGNTGYITWDMEHGICNMEYITWDTEHGIWNMGYGTWDMKN